MIAAVSLTNINMNQLAVDDPWVADWLEICWKCFTTVFCETALPRFVAWPPDVLFIGSLVMVVWSVFSYAASKPRTFVLHSLVVFL